MTLEERMIQLEEKVAELGEKLRPGTMDFEIDGEKIAERMGLAVSKAVKKTIRGMREATS